MQESDDMVMKMRSIVTSKLAFGLVVLAANLVANLVGARSAQAEMMVPISVSGGQFSLDLKIQGGQTQNYSYHNQQLPTLLTPVGTVSLTNATIPILSGSKALNYVPPVTNIPTSALLNLTGSTSLYDGRTASFNGAPAILHGVTNFSSPFPIEALEWITFYTPSNSQPTSVVGNIPSLPQDYSGIIAFQVQSGHFLVPSTAFSAPSPSLTPLEISSGEIELRAARQDGRAVGDYFPSQNKTSYAFSRYRLITFAETEVSPDSRHIIPSNQVTLLSPIGTTNLSLTHMAQSIDLSSQAASGFMEGTYNPANYISSALATGTIVLSDGKVVQVSDQLMTFQGRTIFRKGYIGNMLIGDFTIDVTQGSLYINAPKINVPKEVNIPKSVNPQIAIDPLAKLAISTTTPQALPENVEQLKLNQELKPSSKLSSDRAVLESPLSSSRILSEVGAFR